MGNAGSGRECGQDAPLGSGTAGAAPGTVARAARRALLMQPLNYIRTKQSAPTRGGQTQPSSGGAQWPGRIPCQTKQRAGRAPPDFRADKSWSSMWK